MKNKIKRLVDDLTALDPALSAQTPELEKTIKQLLLAKPKAKMSASFKNSLRLKLRQNMGKAAAEVKIITPPGPIFSWFRLQRLRLAAAATVFSLLLIGAVALLPLLRQYQEDTIVSGYADRETAEKSSSAGKAKETPEEKLKQGDISLGSIQPEGNEAKENILPSLIKDSATSDLSKNNREKREYDKSDDKLKKPDSGEDKGTRENLLEKSPVTEEETPPSAKDKDATGRITGRENPETVKSLEQDDKTGLLAEKEALPSVSEETNEKSEVKGTTVQTVDKFEYDLDSGFFSSAEYPLSGLAVNTESTSYTRIKSYLQKGELPPAAEIRIEELINYFDYQYTLTSAERPVSLFTEIAACPWNTEHKLLLIGLQAKTPSAGYAPAEGAEGKNSRADKERIKSSAAADVKMELVWNPSLVNSYRLIGYENLPEKPLDFAAEKGNRGEPWSGRAVLILYEIAPGKNLNLVEIPQKESADKGIATPGEILTLRLHYSIPGQDEGTFLEISIHDEDRALKAASDDFRLAAAVAEWGLLLLDSRDRGTAFFGQVIELAQSVKGNDPQGKRAEFLKLVEKSRLLKSKKTNK